MRNLSIFLYEWKHFTRNPFKIIAVILFALAGIYGLHNGQHLYDNQMEEIGKIQQKQLDEKAEILAYYDEGQKGPKEKPWVDLTQPMWANYYTPNYSLKVPSPVMVYAIGQAELYGFYKKVTFFASPYDADMAEEIANPERLQTGTLDFAFAVLFLLPLLLLILVYNLKSTEAEQGFLPLIEVQVASKNTWLLWRMAFYLVLSGFVLIGLLIYGTMLTPVFETAGNAFLQLFLYSFLYFICWAIIYFLILKSGNRILGNTLTMIGIWLLFAFVIPATVQQVVSIKKTANLMTDFIDVDRDQKKALFAQPDSVLQNKLDATYPQIVKSRVYGDSTKRKLAMSRTDFALVNGLKKESIEKIEADNEEKNRLVENTFWFNPVSFFQNKFNRISRTHFDDYQKYRHDIQNLVDKQATLLVLDTWNEVTVDKEKYMEYLEVLGGK